MPAHVRMSACWGKPDVIGGASVDGPKADFVLGQEWGAADLLPAMQCDAQGMQESVSFSANDAYCAVL